MKYRILQGQESVQGSFEWKEFRKGKIGASMASAIMNKNPWKTPLKLYEDIMENTEIPDNPAMSRGRSLEPIARRRLNILNDWDLQPQVVIHPTQDWHFSSLDGLYTTPLGETIACEIKCPGKKDHEMAMDGVIPEHYKPQLIHQMEDLNIDRILYYSYFSETSSSGIWFERDVEESHTQFAEELSFFVRLINFNPPDPTDDDWDEIHDERSKDFASVYQFLSKEIEALELQKKQMRKELILCTKCNRTKIGDLRVQLIKRRSPIKYEDIPELISVDLEKYRGNPIETWRID